MSRDQAAGEWQRLSSTERSALRAVASLFRQLPGQLCLGDLEIATRLKELGLTPEQAGVVGPLLKLAGPRSDTELPGDLVIAPPESCPIAWRPTVLTPVFWGRQIFEASGCLPALTRVYYPSLDGSPQNARMLDLCGRYPLIMFLHGDCGEEPNYVYRWERHLAQLARSGFVVVAPFVPSISGGPQSDESFDTAVGVLRWVRREWQGRGNLLPQTGIFGHSYGGMVACRVAVQQALSCFAGLNAGWHEWSGFGSAPIPLFQLAAPSLHMWGTSSPDDIKSHDFDRIAAPRHRVELTSGDHWVYLQGQTGGCIEPTGAHHLLGAIAGDLLAGFFARYLPPSELSEAGAAIPPSLVPPHIDLSFDQQFYAGGHLSGLEGLRYADKSCTVPVSWTTGAGSGQVTLQGGMPL